MPRWSHPSPHGILMWSFCVSFIQVPIWTGYHFCPYLILRTPSTSYQAHLELHLNLRQDLIQSSKIHYSFNIESDSSGCSVVVILQAHYHRAFQLSMDAGTNLRSMVSKIDCVQGTEGWSPWHCLICFSSVFLKMWPSSSRCSDWFSRDFCHRKVSYRSITSM